MYNLYKKFLLINILFSPNRTFGLMAASGISFLPKFTQKQTEDPCSVLCLFLIITSLLRIFCQLPADISHAFPDDQLHRQFKRFGDNFFPFNPLH